MVKHVAFGIAALMPSLFSFQKSSPMPMRNSHMLPLQATCYYAQDGNNDKLPTESAFLLQE